MASKAVRYEPRGELFTNSYFFNIQSNKFESLFQVRKLRGFSQNHSLIVLKL